MNWSWLITLICPLMMLFMMFGLGGKHGHGHGSRKQASPDYQEIQKELNDLKIQNEQMRRDIQSLTL
ncbi:DUF2933 domain-containing protein [Paenibacillus sp.]|uniref:DUF2933 domain-containing protein n=1 Tax=Paenibacillus sp. TaxID=58172 RepID=UPI0028ADD22A|nr:DUF2933 domain-containing protein [Paenibacillus sp.]